VGAPSDAGTYTVKASFGGNGNYEPSSDTATITITKKSITGNFTADDKVYDGNTSATVLTRTLNNTVSGDVVSLVGGTATFDSKSVGLGKTVTLTGATLSGADAGNYSLTSVGTTAARISAKPITGDFTTPASRVYDGTTNATVNTRSLNNTVSLDNVSLTGGIASFANKNVANGKTVTLTGATLTGTDAGNYSLTSVGTQTADITAKPLTVTATGINKVFNGTTTATVTLASNALIGDTVNVSYSGASFADPNIGTGKPVSVAGISISGVDAGNYSLLNTTATTTANITSLATITAVSVSPTSQQYSDTVNFKATISPGTAGSVAAAATVTFKVGTLAMGTANLVAGTGTDAGKLVATLSAPLLDASLSSPAGSGPMTPGAKTVTAVINGKNPNFTISDPTTSLTVTQEDARATYAGDMLAFTSGGAATVTLRATIQDITAVLGDPDANAGDIRNAKVTFTSNGGTLSSGCSNIPVTLLASDTTTGSVSCTGTFSSGSGGSAEYQITTTVSGYYTDSTSNVPTVIEIADPTGTFITGGGYLNETNSAGSSPAANPSKMNFGFNVKYNKSGTNPQGHVTIIYRSGGHVYQIKTTATDTFGTSLKTPPALTAACAGPPSATCWGLASWSSKANLTDITNPNAPVNVGGGLTLQMSMTDKGEPGKDDSIAVTLWNGSTLIFSSNWSGAKTVEQTLGGGNLVVH
jgi:trimeric autotransporter adhesin